MKDKKIVIGVTGSAAAFKAAILASRLKQDGYSLRTVLTENAQRFIGVETFKALTRNPVFCRLFPRDNTFDAVLHIGLARWLDLLAIVPATANVIGKIAGGIADDLLTSLVLAVDKPVLIAPAMNKTMYLNPAVQDNIKLLRQRGYHIIEPADGHLACGESGKGRLVDPEDIIKKIGGLI